MEVGPALRYSATDFPLFIPLARLFCTLLSFPSIMLSEHLYLVAQDTLLMYQVMPTISCLGLKAAWRVRSDMINAPSRDVAVAVEVSETACLSSEMTETFSHDLV